MASNCMKMVNMSGFRQINFYVCPCKDCPGNIGEIELYYSEQHATDKGWRFTTHGMYSHNGDVVAVCPECSKGETWIENKGDGNE